MNPSLEDECRVRAIALLKRNLSRAGVRAATPGARVRRRHYDAVFARDASICALGMAVSGDSSLARRAARALGTLAAQQAPNGQIPNFVDTGRRAPDFWYVGCIDATLWWLVAVSALGVRDRFARRIERAIAWLAAQEHPRFGLVQQNEASDWADIMPRSGFVLYTNALWYLVKRLYRLPGAAATHRWANALLRPFAARPPRDRRARQLTEDPRRRARRRELYLSFVNFGAFGDEGDVFGNLLALFCGLASGSTARRVLRALERARVDVPYPVRAVVAPILPRDSLWRSYMLRHRQNLPWQYHNGGVWPFIGGFWVAALARHGRRREAREALERLARANALGRWAFNEWLDGRTAALRGMRGQSWNAATYLMAYDAVRRAPARRSAQRRASGRACP